MKAKEWVMSNLYSCSAGDYDMIHKSTNTPRTLQRMIRRARRKSIGGGDITSYPTRCY